MSPLLLASLQLIATMGMAKHIPTKMSVMPTIPSVERGTVGTPGRETTGKQSVARDAGRIPGVDGIMVRRAAQTTFEPLRSPPAKVETATIEGRESAPNP
jgi:hypothetical protein